MSARRAQLILEAFQKMDKDKSGAVNAQDLKARHRIDSRAQEVTTLAVVCYRSSVPI